MTKSIDMSGWETFADHADKPSVRAAATFIDLADHLSDQHPEMTQADLVIGMAMALGDHLAHRTNFRLWDRRKRRRAWADIIATIKGTYNQNAASLSIGDPEGSS